MISQNITHELAMQLNELNFSVQEYVVLLGELEDEEAKKINNIQNAEKKLSILFELLNQNQRLPEQYKDRVKNYKGFKGAKINFKIFI